MQRNQDGQDRPVSASTRMSSKYGEHPDNDKDSFTSTFTDGFQVNHNKIIPEIPRDKCVLDFGKNEIEILKEIAKIIEKEQVELEEEIQVQQELIMNRGKPKQQPKPEVLEEPTPKELYEFKSKLEVSLYINYIFRKHILKQEKKHQLNKSKHPQS